MPRADGEVLSQPAPRSLPRRVSLWALWLLPLAFAAWLVVQWQGGGRMTPLRWAVIPIFVTAWFAVFVVHLKGEQARRAVSRKRK